MRQIKKSEIAAIPSFEAKVAAHAFELKNWRAHMQRVSDDEKNKVTVENRHVAYKEPRSHPIVESALNEAGEPEYQIVDDGPTPVELLVRKKDDLLGRVGAAEAAAANGIWPSGKRRLDLMRENDINNADIARQRDIATQRSATERGAIAKAVLGPKYSNTVREEGAAARPTADTTFLADIAARRAKVSTLERIAAQAQSDIEDLTAENIGAWKMPDFTA